MACAADGLDLLSSPGTLRLQEASFEWVGVPQALRRGAFLRYMYVREACTRQP